MSRDSFYQVPDVPVADLLLDTFNPRIRHGQDQNDCIHRLLRDRANFINLCKDIAARGLTPEHILVSKNADGKWVVRDGNRRVAALKLLNTPSQVHADTALFNTLTRAAGMPGVNIPSQINCLACDDEQIIRDYLERKHTGANQGIGQKNWTALLKSFFNIQADARDDYKRAAQLLLWLEEHEYGGVDDDFYITTLQRGLNTDTLALIGFAVRDDDLVPILPVHQAYDLAARVVRAIGSGEVNVKREEESGSIITPEAQLAFFTAVRNEIGPPIAVATPVPGDSDLQPLTERAGIRPPAAPAGNQSATGTPPPAIGGQWGATPPPASIPTRLPASPATAPRDRKFLFGTRKTASPGLSIPPSETKVQTIIAELRKLNPHETSLATTMLLRALIELSNDYYRAQHDLPPKEQTALHKSIAHTANHMGDANILTEPEHTVVMNYTQGSEGMLHIRTIQAYIHSTEHHPNGQALNTIWDDISCFVRACWK
ncbi:MAG: hypothetical protein PHD37_06515 [Gallionellaceae bacterium]|nr:hypothetical protein [Gallionellaceae bacterium]